MKCGMECVYITRYVEWNTCTLLSILLKCGNGMCVCITHYTTEIWNGNVCTLLSIVLKC